ncbi:Uncharacterised protein [Escherichia coli]|nr:Uncharacterised protein [Escherichia coli]CAD5665058.1 Uncharacterised protein [Escherichia coli]CAD5830134.1 Uncharacterised protein [Escherichia coli]
MRDDFCAFILTHGRPDKVLTYTRCITTDIQQRMEISFT